VLTERGIKKLKASKLPYWKKLLVVTGMAITTAAILWFAFMYAMNGIVKTSNKQMKALKTDQETKPKQSDLCMFWLKQEDNSRTRAKIKDYCGT
jgi:hypothetical protein